MKAFLDTPPCEDTETDKVFGYDGYLGEDQYIGLNLFAKLRVRLIQCGSFHITGLSSKSCFPSLIIVCFC
jgi:hypothetical protein